MTEVYPLSGTARLPRESEPTDAANLQNLKLRYLERAEMNPWRLCLIPALILSVIETAVAQTTMAPWVDPRRG